MRVKKILAILFADIAGSTRLYETLGDARAREVTADCIEFLRKITAQHKGQVIKTIGDEVMCTFPSADKAGEAAIRMQEELQDYMAQRDVALRIRVGFHYGEVIEEHGDVFGDAVNTAARMAAQARGDQIITTGDTLDMMSPYLKTAGRVLITTTVKGKKTPVQICELTWGEEEELTVYVGSGSYPTVSKSTPKLRVSFEGQEVVVDDANPLVSMGRDMSNSLVVPDEMSSRRHAKLECRRGKFVLVDHSTNGTYVVLDSGPVYLVHRDEMLLEGTGVFGLGRDISPDDPMAVRFAV